MIVLGIESTCDETAASLVVDGNIILSQVISSQVDLHNIYGGVVPELACRRHMEVVIPVIDQALKEASKTLQDIDLIAVAYGPGLIGPLFVGIQTAKALAFSLNKPLVGVNHIEAHLYAGLMSASKPPTFPLLGVVLSGGHTTLLEVKSLGHYKLLGQTVDDAIGEAFDKVAKLLGLPYPGGPPVEALAKEGNPHKFPFKGGRVKTNPLNFSFSGLKTAVLYTFKEGGHNPADLCASFQEAAFSDVLKKIEIAAKQIGSKEVLFGGGVTNSETFRKLFLDRCPDLKGYFPSRALTLDNASMIAGLGYHIYKLKGENELSTLEAKTRIPFST